MIHRLRGEIDIDEELWCIDGATVRAHRCASGGGKKTMPTNRHTTRSDAAAVV